VTTSWGGSVIESPEDGRFYMMAAEMTNECDLSGWQTNSQVVLILLRRRRLGFLAFSFSFK
jgi:hypothetical protein